MNDVDEAIQAKAVRDPQFRRSLLVDAMMALVDVI
jgi:hypothetical protein